MSAGRVDGWARGAGSRSSCRWGEAGAAKATAVHGGHFRIMLWKQRVARGR